MTKRALITGVTGTLGMILHRQLLNEGWHVTGFARDEQKLRQIPPHENLSVHIADVRDYGAVAHVAQIAPVNLIFHLAALKCVDTLEFHAEEALKTNVHGTLNIVEIANVLRVPLVFTSTDKAAHPINTYGVSKAMAEKIVLQAGHAVVRYGNVIGSRGSFIPSLIGTLRTEKKAYVTHPEMSRFWMSPQQAASFVRSSVEKGPGLHLPTEIRASSILKMVAAVADFAGVDIYDIKEIGIRPGEKLHETLRTEEEGGLIRSDDRDVQFDPKSLVQFVRNVMMGEA